MQLPGHTTGGCQGKGIPKMGTWLNQLPLQIWTNYSSDGKWGEGEKAAELGGVKLGSVEQP